MLKSISRNDEANLPDFKSHDEARTYFKNIYGDSFQMTDSDVIDGMKIYFYKLILNQVAFNKGITELKEKGFSSDIDFMMSTQDIEIWEDGRIHVLH